MCGATEHEEGRRMLPASLPVQKQHRKAACLCNLSVSLIHDRTTIFSSTCPRSLLVSVHGAETCNETL